MNGLHRYPADVDVPEHGRRWRRSPPWTCSRTSSRTAGSRTFVDSAGETSDALLGRDWQHWSFFADVDGSFMEGCGWAQVGPDTFVTDDASSRFGRLDQYLMGLRTRGRWTRCSWSTRPPTSIRPARTSRSAFPRSVSAATAAPPSGRWTTSSAPEQTTRADGAVAPRHWRVGFVLVTPRSVDATSADLAELENIRQRFPLTIAQSTEGRGSVDVTLAPRHARDRAPAGARPRRRAARHVPRGRRREERRTVARDRPRRGAAALAQRRIRRVGRRAALARDAARHVRGHAPSPGTGLVQWWLSATAGGNQLVAQWPAAGPQHRRCCASARTSIRRSCATRVNACSRDRLPVALLARVTDNLGSTRCGASERERRRARARERRRGRRRLVHGRDRRRHVEHRRSRRLPLRGEGPRVRRQPWVLERRVRHAARDARLDRDLENTSNWFPPERELRLARVVGARHASLEPRGRRMAWHSGRHDGTAYDPRTDAAPTCRGSTTPARRDA